MESRPVVPAGTDTPGRVLSVAVVLPSGALALVVARRIAGESWRSAVVAPLARVVRARRRADEGGRDRQGEAASVTRNECQRVGSLPVAADAVDVVPLIEWRVPGFPKPPSRSNSVRPTIASIPPVPAIFRRGKGDPSAESTNSGATAGKLTIFDMWLGTILGTPPRYCVAVKLLSPRAAGTFFTSATGRPVRRAEPCIFVLKVFKKQSRSFALQN